MDTEKIHSDKSVVWEQFGPGGSGNNYLIYWHPTDPNVVFQGPNMGNSYVSNDKGETYHGIMDPDGPGYRTRGRGPVELWSPEFSYQNPDFGMCGMEDANQIYVTYNKGMSWVKNDRIAQQFGDEHINTFEVDPNDDNVWFAGSGIARSSNLYVYSHEFPHGVHGAQRSNKDLEGRAKAKKKYKHQAKIWRSLDKGRTWKVVTPKGINPDAQIIKIFVHPGNSKVVFAATTYGFYKSTNGGKKWKLKKNVGFDNDIIRSMDMHYDTKTGKVTLFAIDLVKYIPNGKSMSYNGGVYKSTDEGESWVNLNSNMPLEKELLKTKNIKKSYYKIALSWWFGVPMKEVEKRYSELPEKMMHSVSMVRVNPKNVNHVLVVNNYKSQMSFCGGMIWRTDNGGDNWYVTIRNGRAWDGSDKKKWEARNNPTHHNVDWVGQDEWEYRDDYDRKAGAVVEFNADGSTIMFQVAKVVCTSHDNGDTWKETDEKTTTPEGHNWVGGGNSNLPGEEIIIDKRLKDYIYLCSGENSIFRTTNDGDKVRTGAQAVYKINIPNRESPKECSTSSMVVHPEDINTLYTLHYRQAFFGKLMKSTDGGKNWEVHGHIFNPKDYGNPVKFTIHQKDLSIDPDYTNRFYFNIAKNKVGGLTPSVAGTFKDYGIYRSLDEGVSFDMINDGIPKKPSVQKIILDPNNKGVVWAALAGSQKAPGGLFRLADGSDTWEKMSTPNNMFSVHDIHFSEDNIMYVSGGSHGGKTKKGGVWSTKNRKDWEQVFPYAFAHLIRSAPYNPNVLLVTIPSRQANGIVNPGIFRSLDKGKTWSKINTGNIQSDRLNDIDFDYYKKGVYYCSTYGAGYYITKDPSVK